MFWVGPLTAALHTSGTAIKSMMSCLVPETECGAVVALGMAPMAFSFLVAPLIAASVVHHNGFEMLPWVALGSLITMSTFAVVLYDDTTLKAVHTSLLLR